MPCSRLSSSGLSHKRVSPCNFISEDDRMPAKKICLPHTSASSQSSSVISEKSLIETVLPLQVVPLVQELECRKVIEPSDGENKVKPLEGKDVGSVHKEEGSAKSKVEEQGDKIEKPPESSVHEEGDLANSKMEEPV